RFAEHGIDSMATYRQLLREGAFPQDRFGDLFLVIDGWSTLTSEFEDLVPAVVALANRGLGFGVHLIVAANRWMDLRMNVRDMFGTRLELKLGDPLDSVIGRRQQATVPDQTPGRGLTPDAFHFLAAVPRIDGRSTDDGLADAVSQLVTSVNQAWGRPPAPPVRLLPDELPYDQLPPAERTRQQGIPIGIAERDLQPVYLDLREDPHLLLFADVQCGKSSFLRLLASGIMRQFSPEEAQIAVVDFRRSLLGVVPDEYLVGYASNADLLQQMVQLTVESMTKRLPTGEITPEQLRNRSWWSGPELFLLVDDYDLVATSPHTNPLTGLLDLLTQGRDIGFHLIVTRRSGGAGRALFDPVLSRIRDLASPGILMSGNREEGPLLGNLRLEKLPPGRGWLVTRTDGPQLVQLAYLPPAE
ncbi:MAG TPA: type VII secretion protein EccCb, partial [Natronosporangium sp.]|nr:type VII secretion protein EccCb [Natronosporangium sp.]